MRQNNQIKIEDLKKQENFTAPKGYFDDLSSNIQDQISTKTSFYHRRFLKPIAVTATFAILVIAFTMLKPEKRTVAIISQNLTLEEYLLDYEDIDETLIIEELALLDNTENDLEYEELVDYIIEDEDYDEYIYE